MWCYIHGRPLRGGGGARVGVRPSPGKSKQIFPLYWGPFFLLMGGLFTTFSPYRGPFSLCGGLSATFLSMWGPFLVLPLPTKTSVGAHGYRLYCT